ncbi:MAG: TerB family tellurite resistance protein [Candidatus Neomarinimicrobiota bacterium]
MLFRIKSFVSQYIAVDEDQSGGAKGPDPVPLAVCALLLEMAQADGEFTDGEMRDIIRTMEEKFGLTRKDAEKVIELAEEERKASIDLWQFSKLIGDNCNRDEKLGILDTLWAVIYADGILDEHEDYLIHKLAYLLGLSHGEMIDSKLRVAEASASKD